MRPRIVIIGGGTGGTLTANRLHRIYGDSADITVVDRDDRHVYQPGLLFVPFGLGRPGDGSFGSRHAPASGGVITSPRRGRPGRDRRAQTMSTLATAGPRYDVLVDRHRRGAVPGGDRGAHRSGLAGEGVHLLHAGRRRGAAASACAVRAAGGSW